MAVPLEARPSEQLVDLLLDCHGQIRRMMRLARRLALSGPRAYSELREAADAVRSYCLETLPQHEADEELVMIKVAGRDPAFDQVYAQLASEHQATAADIGRLVAICDAIDCDPRQLTQHARELAKLAARLEATYTAHLALEERTLFPVLRDLPADVQDEILSELRARHG